MNIKQTIDRLHRELADYDCTLVAVSKTKPSELILEAYRAGQRDFGENKAQELVKKHEDLPRDIRWHMVGHLQRNKVKYIAPFVHLIHAVDNEKLLAAINKEAEKNARVIDCLLQVRIAAEQSKFGFEPEALLSFIDEGKLADYTHVNVAGLMGMASNTQDEQQVSDEFRGLKQLFDQISIQYNYSNLNLEELSIGMSGDYKIALSEGSTMVRIGSTLFGARGYP